jgi:DNA-binding MarR family transcriptional regulator
MHPPIQETLGHLFAQTSRAVRTYVGQVLANYELYPGQQMILALLWQNEGVTPSYLAECIDVQPPTVTKMLQRMEESGLVERRPAKRDSRVYQVYLTQQGRAMQTELEAAWRQLDTRIFSGFSVEERVIFRRLLLQIQHNLDKPEA